MRKVFVAAAALFGPNAKDGDFVLSRSSIVDYDEGPADPFRGVTTGSLAKIVAEGILSKGPLKPIVDLVDPSADSDDVIVKKAQSFFVGGVQRNRFYLLGLYETLSGRRLLRFEMFILNKELPDLDGNEQSLCLRNQCPESLSHHRILETRDFIDAGVIGEIESMEHYRSNIGFTEEILERASQTGDLSELPPDLYSYYYSGKEVSHDFPVLDFHPAIEEEIELVHSEYRKALIEMFKKS